LPNLVATWLGIIAVVVAGSSNLYWISRRWGPTLLGKPLAARLLHLDERRLLGQSSGHVLSGNAWLYLLALVVAIVLLAVLGCAPGYVRMSR
jgi:hypothetical protein